VALGAKKLSTLFSEKDYFSAKNYGFSKKFFDQNNQLKKLIYMRGFKNIFKVPSRNNYFSRNSA